MGKMKSSRKMVGSPGRGPSAAAAQLLGMPATPLEGRGAPRMHTHSNPMNAPAAPGDAVDRMLGQIMGFVKTRPEIAGAGAKVSRPLPPPPPPLAHSPRAPPHEWRC